MMDLFSSGLHELVTQQKSDLVDCLPCSPLTDYEERLVILVDLVVVQVFPGVRIKN